MNKLEYLQNPCKVSPLLNHKPKKQWCKNILLHHYFLHIVMCLKWWP